MENENDDDQIDPGEPDPTVISDPAAISVFAFLIVVVLGILVLILRHYFG